MPMNGLHREGPPDSEHLAGICPNCNLPSTFEERGSRMVRAGDAKRWLQNPTATNAWLLRAVVYQCRACFDGCLVVEEMHVKDEVVSYKGIHCWPPPGTAQVDDSIPGNLAGAFREGMRCIGAAAPHAAAVMYRRTIEGDCPRQGLSKGSRTVGKQRPPRGAQDHGEGARSRPDACRVGRRRTWPRQRRWPLRSLGGG